MLTLFETDISCDGALRYMPWAKASQEALLEPPSGIKRVTDAGSLDSGSWMGARKASHAVVPLTCNHRSIHVKVIALLTVQSKRWWASAEHPLNAPRVDAKQV